LITDSGLQPACLPFADRFPSQRGLSLQLAFSAGHLDKRAAAAVMQLMPMTWFPVVVPFTGTSRKHVGMQRKLLLRLSQAHHRFVFRTSKSVAYDSKNVGACDARRMM
jgi:hypothetical protein